jgi:hypothetical protein
MLVQQSKNLVEWNTYKTCCNEIKRKVYLIRILFLGKSLPTFMLVCLFIYILRFENEDLNSNYLYKGKHQCRLNYKDLDTMLKLKN